MLPESLLITGPPASGKSHAAVERFLGVAGSLLLTPSITMAEHIRNDLARKGVAVRPARVLTFAQFLDVAVPQMDPAPLPVVHLLVQQALERAGDTRFGRVAQYRGLHQALAALIEEARAEDVDAELASIFRSVEAQLRARGIGLRRMRLQAAAESSVELPPQIVFDGFFSFSRAELSFIRSLALRTAITATLPDGAGAAESRRHLKAFGFGEQRRSDTRRRSTVSAFSAATLEQETIEIARRILEESANGREFREIGVILRSREPYGSALETTFARFGIPARFYFADPIGAHPAVRYLGGMVRVMLEGWDHASLLELLRMPVSGFGTTAQGDRFDFELRKRLPGAGLPLDGIDDVPEVLNSLVALDAWRRQKCTPEDWAARLKTLRTLLPQPAVDGALARETLQAWRSTAAALDAFEAALDATAAALADAGTISLAEFWKQADLTLELEPLRLADRRRNVVHVLDVFEARQWELPVTFVCGMVERHFPQYHREDSLLADAARRRAGLKTSAEAQREEGFLFELATTRAKEKTILSYARFNEKGEETLPSFFLQGIECAPCEERIRPRAKREVAAPAASAIGEPELLGRLMQRHQTLAPTSIESFLQCPFQFFSSKTLRLRARPAAPRERLDVLLQGSILHRVLAEYSRMPLLGVAVFDQVFADECRRALIPQTYRTEAIRLELLRNFEAFLTDDQFTLNWPSRIEEKFSFALNPFLKITGRIDRLELGPGNQALVIDYKYSAASKIRDRVEESDAGNLVQGGLYLLAAEKQFGLQPAGMLFCGLRKEVAWDGWHVPIAGLERLGESVTRDGLDRHMQAAAAKAVEVFEAITSGTIAPKPADTDKCMWCDFRDVCRVESASAKRKAGA